MPTVGLRGWRDAAEVALFEISNSMKRYPSVFHAHTGKLEPAIVVSDPSKAR